MHLQRNLIGIQPLRIKTHLSCARINIEFPSQIEITLGFIPKYRVFIKEMIHEILPKIEEKQQ
jgi:hypothetical protein